MNQQRPVFLDLTKMRFPVMAITSILHRISGVVLFLYLPFVLWHLQSALASEMDFMLFQQSLSTGLGKLLLWALVTATLYHLFAGVRHLLMDMGMGESLRGGRMSAWIMLAVSLIASLYAGYVICC